MKKVLVGLGLGLMMLSSSGFAGGDVDKGKTLSGVCAACHGGDGNSANPTWPKLAGQTQPYLVKQLKNFKEGERKNPLMSPMAAGLSDQDMADLAAYFSAQKVTNGTVSDPELVATGEHLYRGGNAKTGLPACIACHGPAGRGMSAAGFPAIRGQHGAYTTSTLKAFKTGQRTNDLNSMMQDVATKASDAEIKALAAYLEVLK